MPRKELSTRPDPDEAMVALEDEPIRHVWVWFVYVGLFAISIPWYFPAGDYPSIWFGLPSWVVISFAATVGVALFTVFVIRNYWSAGDPE